MNKRMKMAFLGSLMGLYFFGASAFAANGDALSAQKESELAVLNEGEVDEPRNWMYELKEDRMYGTRYHISTKSVNEEDLGRGVVAPMSLILRERGDNDYDVMLKLNGYFHCTPGVLCETKIRFDNGKILSYAITLAGQGVQGISFISSRGHFLQMIKAAKKMVIAVPITGVGYKNFEFDVVGLETE